MSHHLESEKFPHQANSLFEDKLRGKIPNQFQEVSQVRLEFCFLCYASQLNSVVHVTSFYL